MARPATPPQAYALVALLAGGASLLAGALGLVVGESTARLGPAGTALATAEDAVHATLRSLFELYRASRWQTLRHLRIPSAMPYFLGGLRIAGGLSLIGAVVAEYVAGTSGTGTGLAFRILEAGYRLQIPKMFAALILLAFTGIAIFIFFSTISHLALRSWHESAVKRES